VTLSEYLAEAERLERELADRTRLDAMLNFERVLWRAGVQHIAGVDEVGMGPLAGPVIAASWNVDDNHALAFANSAGASNCGRMVLTEGDANARAVPITARSDRVPTMPPERKIVAERIAVSASR